MFTSTCYSLDNTPKPGLKAHRAYVVHLELAILSPCNSGFFVDANWRINPGNRTLIWCWRVAHVLPGVYFSLSTMKNTECSTESHWISTLGSSFLQTIKDFCDCYGHTADSRVFHISSAQTCRLVSSPFYLCPGHLLEGRWTFGLTCICTQHSCILRYHEWMIRV